MTEREALLAAVGDDPDGDLPRLAYADWCDAHGDPERAEFIRVQCELAGGRPDAVRRVVLKLRESQLASDHFRHWTEPLRGLVSRVEFRRGFIDRVELARDVTARQITAVLAAAPFAALRDVSQQDRLGEYVAALPAMGRVTGLEFWGLIYEYTDADVAALLTSEHLSRLRTLVLHAEARNGRMADDAVLVAGLTSPFRSRLRTLAVNFDDSHRGPSAAVVSAIATSPHLHRLRRLTLSHAELTDETVDQLAAARFFPRLRWLDLAGCDLRLATWERLLDRLRSGSPPGRLRWLRLYGARASEHLYTPLTLLTNHPVSAAFDAAFGLRVVDRQSDQVTPGDCQDNLHPSARRWEWDGRLVY